MRWKLLTVFAVVALSTAAHAKDMSGRVGLGADTSLGFAGNNLSGVSGVFGLSQSSGLSIVYRATKMFGIQMIFSTEQVSSTASGSEYSSSDVGIALRGTVALITRGDLTLQGVAGLGYRAQSEDDDFGMEILDASDITIEAGLRPEWFVSEHLSFHTQIGLVLSILDSGSLGSTADGTFVSLFGAQSLLGTAGFTFYF